MPNSPYQTTEESEDTDDSDQPESFEQAYEQSVEEYSEDDEVESETETNQADSETDESSTDDSSTEDDKTESTDSDDSEPSVETDESSDDSEETDESEPRIPKSRLDEEINKKKSAQERVQELQRTQNQYLNNPDAARELIQYYQNEDLVDLSDFVNGGSSDDTDGFSVDEIESELQSSGLPDQSVQQISKILGKVLENTQQQNGNQQTQQVQQQSQQQLDPKLQNAQSQFQNKIQQMQNDEETYPFYDDVTETVDELDDGTPVTIMDQVANQNPEEFYIEVNGQPILDPNKLDTLYNKAVAEAGVLNQTVESAKKEGATEKEQEFQENKNKAPMEPAGSTDADGPEPGEGEIDTFEDALDQAAVEHDINW